MRRCTVSYNLVLAETLRIILELEGVSGWSRNVTRYPSRRLQSVADCGSTAVATDTRIPGRGEKQLYLRPPDVHRAQRRFPDAPEERDVHVERGERLRRCDDDSHDESGG